MFSKRPLAKRRGARIVALLSLVLLAGVCAFGQQGEQGGRAQRRRQSDPVAPFRIIGNIYYVGGTDMTSYLITTSQGHILIDSTYEETVPMIRDSVQKMGFHMRDIRILLNSHGHSDHLGGHKLMKEFTGAEVWISEGDAPILISGGEGIRALQPDRIFPDGEKVSLAGVTITANLTPGHTKGCTTWTTVAEEAGKRYNVVFWCGLGGLGSPLLNNPAYPNLAEDALNTLRKAKTIPCDVFLGPHAEGYGILEKMKRLQQGETPNPFIDPQGCRASIEPREKQLQEQLEKERSAARGAAVP